MRRPFTLQLPLGVREVKVLTLREEPPGGPRLLDTPQGVYDLWQAQVTTASWYTGDVETLVVFHLNTRRHLCGWNLVSIGLLDTLLVHPREIFRTAIIANAAAIVMAHNHPGGDPSPSEADIRVTRQLIQAGQLLKIELLDHVVIGAPAPERVRPWCSLRELGYFYS